MVPPASRTALLARRLARAVDAERRDRVVLAVRPRLRAVEHVVGRDVEQRNAALGARAREMAGARRVDRERLASRSVSALSTAV